MTYTVKAVHGTGGMACRVTATAISGKYRIETTTSPTLTGTRVLMRLRFRPLSSSYHLYVRLDATVNGNGGGGNGGADSATVDRSSGHPLLVSSDPVTATNAANRDYAQPVHAALDGPFVEVERLAGTPSDGLQLDASHGLTSTYDEAVNGNVVQTARVDPQAAGETVLSLGFGASREDAVAAATGSRAASFRTALMEYTKGWKRYDESLLDPRRRSSAASAAATGSASSGSTT